MSSVYPILAENATSISELKKNPMAVIAQADGMPVAVLNRNQPAFYCIPAQTYQLLMNKIEELESSAADYDELWAKEAEDRLAAAKQGKIQKVSEADVFAKYFK